MVFSLASETFGSSNGLMPSAAPATAVANSQRKNSAPSRVEPRAQMQHRMAGRFERREPCCVHGRRDRSRWRRRRDRRRIRRVARAASSTTGSAPLPCLPVLSAISCSIHRPSEASDGGRTDRELVAPVRRRGADERAELQTRIGEVLLPAAVGHRLAGREQVRGGSRR